MVRMGDGKKLPGHWVYGGIFPGTGAYSVIYGWESKDEQTGATLKKLTVYSDTVGQYTGLNDKNGQRIFEGDILKAPLGDRLIVFAVEWDKENGRFLGFTSDRQIVYAGREPKAEIIGNIYDNPELISQEGA